MYKKIAKLALNINHKWLTIITIFTGIASLLYFTPKFVKNLNDIYPKLNNESFKEFVNILRDIDIFLKSFNWIIYICITIFTFCIVIIVLRATYKEEEIINKIIIGHSTMDKIQLKVRAEGSYTVKELDLCSEMKDITLDYEKVKFAINNQDKFVENFKNVIDNKHQYGYMGIAHTPLILRMGYQIGDGNRFNLYHKKRNSEVFKELSKNEIFKQINVVAEITDKDSEELIVGISTTFEIKYDELKILKPDEKNILLFSCEELDYDVISERKQVDFYIKYIMKKVRKLVKDKDIKKIHMVLSTSTVMTFALGQAIKKSYDPEIIIYNYEKNNPIKYTWGIELYKECTDCLIITSDD